MAVEDGLGEAECRGAGGGFLSREKSAVLGSSWRVVRFDKKILQSQTKEKSTFSLVWDSKSSGAG